MRILLFFIGSLVFLSEFSYSQPLFKMLSEQTVDANRMVVDELGNVYLMNTTGIERRNAVGNGIFRTSEMQWGQFNPIDVTDPLRPFVHFPASGKIVFFDNTLSVQGSPIDLFELGYDNVELMCGSRGDGFWLWDGRNAELTRVNRSFAEMQTSGNLSILLKTELHPLIMMERGNFLFVLNDDYRLHVFDMFGAWKKSLQLPMESTWEAESGKVYVFRKDGLMQSIDTNMWLTQEASLPVTDGSFSFHNGLLYCLKEKTFRVYEVIEKGRN
jgi:hypothetical protein